MWYKDARFWSAVVLLVKVVVFQFKPDFPSEVWDAVENLVNVLLVAILGASVTKQEVERRRGL